MKGKRETRLWRLPLSALANLRSRSDFPLFLIVAFLPLVSHIQAIQTNWGVALDPLLFWKDKCLWILTFLTLFTLKHTNRFILIFFGFLFWSTLFSQNILLSIWGMSNYAEGSITFFCYGILIMAAQDFPPKLFNKAAAVVICGMGIFAILQMYYGAYLLFPPLRYLSGLSDYRVTGISFPLFMSLNNPNHLGHFCALLLPIMLRLPNYYLSAILAALAVGSNSRAAWVAIALTLPYRKIWKPLVVVLPPFIFFYRERIFALTTSVRLFMWKNTFPLTGLLGKGPATLMLDFPQKKIPSTIWPQGTMVDRPHNLYLQIAHATGWLSLIPLACVVFVAVKKDTPYRWGILGFLLCGIFTDSMVGVTPLFCIVLGMLQHRKAAEIRNSLNH